MTAIGDALTGVWAWLLTYGVHSTLLLTLAWLWTRRRRKAPAAHDERIWKAAVIGGILTASLQLLLGLQPALGGWTLPAEEAPHAVAAASGEARPSTLADARAPQRFADGRTQFPWRTALLGGWAVIGLLGMLVFARSWSQLLRMLADRYELNDDAVEKLFTSVRKRAGVRRRIRLSVSPSIPAPMTFGFVQREICLPVRALDALTRDQQEALLAHELGHAVRRDPLWFNVLQIVEKVFFFQPLNRVARRELSEEAEEACDDWAVRWTGKRLPLASCLAEIGQWLVAPPQRALSGERLVASMAGGSRLGHRIERLLDDRRSPHPAPERSLLETPATLATLGLVAWAAPGIAQPIQTSPINPISPTSIGRPENRAVPTPAEARPLHVLTNLAPSGPGLIPAGLPAPPAEPPLALERELLASEWKLLRVELNGLRKDLAASDLAQELAEPLANIEEHLRALDSKHRRLDRLLELTVEGAIPATVPGDVDHTPDS